MKTHPVLYFFLLFLGLPLISMAIEPIEPIPISVEYDEAKAKIGKALFFDPILSVDRSTSCANCHSFDKGGADDRVVSMGIHQQKGNVQSPTVLNARFNFKQFWNGRADNLLEQASGPVHNPVEMGMNANKVEKRINASQKYRKMFADIGHHGHISFQMIMEAIVEFENALITPNSKFDRYLRGQYTLSTEEAEGYQIFKTMGCITCHNGINIGGNSFQKMGLLNPYQHNNSYPDLYAVTKKEMHKNVFKVPTLRNIELTAPYFHDGSSATLHEAIDKMSFHNLGYKLSNESVDKLVSFLQTLTGDRPAILE
jgi:cytochrome c peroxidase